MIGFSLPGKTTSGLVLLMAENVLVTDGTLNGLVGGSVGVVGTEVGVLGTMEAMENETFRSPE